MKRTLERFKGREPLMTEREKVLLKLFGIKLISFQRRSDGEIAGTGLLNPLLDWLSLFTMLYFQTKFYKQYENLALKDGKRVSNVFAPPVGTRPQFRALKNLAKTHIFRKPFPVAMTFAVTYRCQCVCPHCSAGRNKRDDLSELNTEEANSETSGRSR